MKVAAKKTLGIFLVLLGFLALLTPFTPGSWLVLIGLEILGLRLIFLDTLKVRISVWREKFRTSKSHGSGRVEKRMIDSVPVIHADMSIKEVRAFLRSKKWDSVNYVYRTDAAGRLTGVCSIKKLIYSKDEESVQEFMKEPRVVVHPHTHQERAALLAVEHNIKAIPVVDTQGVFMGVIPNDEILQILHEEHVEDLLRSSGIGRTEVITDIFKARLSHLVALRLPWLIVGFLGAMGTALFARMFERTIVEELALVFFMPAVIYMSGAVGTQTQTLFIRALALKRHAMKTLVMRELFQGIAIGILVGIVAFGIVSSFTGTYMLAATVAISMTLAIIAAVIVGILTPSLLMSVGRDPALGSGPFVTVITDLIGITLYLTIATIIFL